MSNLELIIMVGVVVNLFTLLLAAFNVRQQLAASEKHLAYRAAEFQMNKEQHIANNFYLELEKEKKEEK